MPEGPGYILLRGRLQLCKNQFSTVEQMVDYLQRKYPRVYGRLKKGPLTSMVLKAIGSSPELIRKRQPPRKRQQSDQGLGFVDVMKLMVQENYRGSRIAREEKKTPEEKRIEEPKRRKIDAEDEAKEKGLVGSAPREAAVTSTDVKRGEKRGPRFRDLGGMQDLLEELEMEVVAPLVYSKELRETGIPPVTGMLLYGPPGCGKTTLADTIANETGLPYYKVPATQLVSGENIRDLFDKAQRDTPSIIFIDEIDAIGSKRDSLNRDSDRRIVSELMSCMDGLHTPVKSSGYRSSGDLGGDSDAKQGYVLVIGATNRPDALDPALRKPGRFTREIALRGPDEGARVEILSALTRDLKLEDTFDLQKIARSTPGFVGADLRELVIQAGRLAETRRLFNPRKEEFNSREFSDRGTDHWWQQPLSPEADKLSVMMDDFEDAIRLVQPSSRREGFSEIPDVTWEDVGGLASLRQAFYRHIIRGIRNPERCKKFGLDLAKGFLLFGPPGCGKTLIAKAVANESGASFIHIKAPELLNKYVGESEAAVRRIFARARTCSPCIVFFDEIDTLAEQRGTGGSGRHVDSLVNQLLIELNGGDPRPGVFVIGATNRIKAIDHAFLRAGRFEEIHYVGLPSAEDRASILKALGRKRPLDTDVDLDSIARMEACENFSGADLAILMNNAAMLGEEEDGSETIKTVHFVQALSKISPRVSQKEIQHYEKLAKEFKVGLD